MVGLGTSLALAGTAAAGAAILVGCCMPTPIPEAELDSLAESRVRRQAAAERRRLRSVAGHWLSQHQQPRTLDHPYVFRLFAEMGDFPLGREYYTIAYRRVARWFKEEKSIEDCIDRCITEVIGPPPAPVTPRDEGPEEGVLDEARAEYDAREARMRLELIAQYKKDPLRFCQQWSDFLFNNGERVYVLRPPDNLIYRISSQIIEAAIALRVDNLEVTQNVVASEVVQRAADRSTSFGERLWLLRAGVIPWTRVFSQSAQPARPVP